MILTIDELKKMNRDYIFRFGYSGGNIWVAKRGYIHDWAIYTHPYTFHHHIKGGFEWMKCLCARVGRKVYDETQIKQLVPCEDEAFEVYRY